MDVGCECGCGWMVAVSVGAGGWRVWVDVGCGYG